MKDIIGKDLFNFDKINIEEITLIQLTVWLRKRFDLSLKVALVAAKLIKEANRLGRIRGELIKTGAVKR